MLLLLLPLLLLLLYSSVVIVDIVNPLGKKKQKFKTLENVNVPEKAVSLHDH